MRITDLGLVFLGTTVKGRDPPPPLSGLVVTGPHYNREQLYFLWLIFVSFSKHLVLLRMNWL